MNKLFQRSLSAVCLFFTLNFGQAEPVITEYHYVNAVLKIDLTDKKIQKSVYGRGILDIVWNETNSTIAITYDPKVSEAKDIWRSLQDVLNLNLANNHGGYAKFQNK